MTVIPKALPRSIIMLLHKGHAAINQMTTEFITPNRVPPTIRIDKGTTFTIKEFKGLRNALSVKLIYRKSYIQTPTNLVKRAIKTLEDYLRTDLEDERNVNEALVRSIKTRRKTVHSSIN